MSAVIQKSSAAIKAIADKLSLYRRIAAHPHTPRFAAWLVMAAVFYLAMPFDLIPDWIPGIGQIDDLIVVPTLLWLAFKRIPTHVVAECTADLDAKKRT